MEYSHRIKWSDELIEKELKTSIRLLGINHFPTHSEMEKLTNGKALAIAVSKHGGTKVWADRLGMEQKQCESEFGTRYELMAINDIKEKIGLQSVLTKPRHPYDIYVNDRVKIDVKAARTEKTRTYNSWSFNLEKKQPTCDIFVVYCIGDDGEVARTYLIPSCVLSGKKQLGISNKSCYENFLNRWDFIETYNQFLGEIINDTKLIGKRRSTIKTTKE